MEQPNAEAMSIKDGTDGYVKPLSIADILVGEALIILARSA
jgi:hypothetical protein